MSPIAGRGVPWALALVLVGTLTAVLRFETIDRRPLWYDEVYTDIACREASGIADAWRADTEHPGLHYLVTCSVLWLAGPSITWIRLASALSGIACVLLSMQLARVLFGRTEGWLTGLLMALSVYHVNYSMDARPYMLLLALMVGQWLALHSVLVRRRPLALVAVALCGAGAVYTHHTALAAEAALGLTALGWLAVRWLGADDDGRREVLRTGLGLSAAFAAIGLLYLPYLATTLQYLDSAHLTAHHTLRLSPLVFHSVFARWASPGWALALTELAFVAGVARILRGWDCRAGLLAWFAAPFLLFGLVPFSKFFDVRFLMTALPPFELIVACGLVALGGWSGAAARRWPGAPTWIGPAAIAGLALAVLIPSAGAYSSFRRTTERCSNFVWSPELLAAHDGFCRDHILLNSLIPQDEELLLRPTSSEKARP